MIFIVGVIIACILALIGTLYVAKNLEDKNYGTVKRRVKNLSIIYGVSFLLLLFSLVLYLFRK